MFEKIQKENLRFIKNSYLCFFSYKRVRFDQQSNFQVTAKDFKGKRQFK